SLLLNGRSIGAIGTQRAIYWFTLGPSGGFGGVNERAVAADAGFAGVGSPAGGAIGFSAIDATRNGFNGDLDAVLIFGATMDEAQCAAMRQRLYAMNWGTP